MHTLFNIRHYFFYYYTLHFSLKSFFKNYDLYAEIFNRSSLFYEFLNNSFIYDIEHAYNQISKYNYIYTAVVFERFNCFNSYKTLFGLSKFLKYCNNDVDNESKFDTASFYDFFYYYNNFFFKKIDYNFFLGSSYICLPHTEFYFNIKFDFFDEEELEEFVFLNDRFMCVTDLYVNENELVQSDFDFNSLNFAINIYFF